MIVNFEDQARLQYTRLLWRRQDFRERFLRHWTDERHPYRERFLEQQTLIEEVLSYEARDDESLDQKLRKQGKSLRTMIREIPPVFGHFWVDSKK
ncbi:MAG: hypothetical protein K1X66_07755 [Verrucomicrobiae bacterium]|nr:hypothetical protein [Verrucomicrobiae bacterium]